MPQDSDGHAHNTQKSKYLNKPFTIFITFLFKYLNFFFFFGHYRYLKFEGTIVQLRLLLKEPRKSLSN